MNKNKCERSITLQEKEKFNRFLLWHIVRITNNKQTVLYFTITDVGKIQRWKKLFTVHYNITKGRYIIKIRLIFRVKPKLNIRLYFRKEYQTSSWTTERIGLPNETAEKNSNNIILDLHSTSYRKLWFKIWWFYASFSY